MAAIASSEPCTRLDMRVLPFIMMTISLTWRVSVSRLPSGVRVSPINSQGFTM